MAHTTRGFLRCFAVHYQLSTIHCIGRGSDGLSFHPAEHFKSTEDKFLTKKSLASWFKLKEN